RRFDAPGISGDSGRRYLLIYFWRSRAAIKQQKYSPILTHARGHLRIDWMRIAVVGLILAFALGASAASNLKFREYADLFPFIGLAIWLAILISTLMRAPDWEVLPAALPGSIFLLALVLSASMMPVEKLPVATWKATLGVGFYLMLTVLGWHPEKPRGRAEPAQVSRAR